MPKVKETASEFLSRMRREYPGVFRTDNSVLFCIYCNHTVTGNKLFNVKQHIAGNKHKEAAKRRTAGQSAQTLLPEYQQTQRINPFNMDLCQTFIEANIPLKKVSHPSVVKFLEKYTSNTMPCESTIRQKYVPILYNTCIEDLQAKAADKHIWVSIDETTDSEQRLVANFMFGLMEGITDENSPERGKCYLLNMAEVDAANSSNMAKFFVDSLSLLWPQGKFNGLRC